MTLGLEPINPADYASPWARVGVNRCPQCRCAFEIGFGKYWFDPATSSKPIDHPPNILTPQAGDLTICPWCASILRYALHRRIHKLEPMPDADFQALGAVMRKVIVDAQYMILTQRQSELTADAAAAADTK